MPQGIVDGRLQISQLFTGVITTSFEDIAVEVAALHELPQSVGQLDLAAGAALGFFEQREDLRRQDVASDDGVCTFYVARRVG